MGSLKLTKRAVEAIEVSDQDQFWWDTDLSGFGLKVTRGGNKVFVVQYRMGGRGTPARRYTIGKQGSWDAATARVEAERLLRLAATGVDPQFADRQRQRDEIELEFSKYAEHFLQHYGARTWKPRTFESRSSDLRRWVVPILKGRALPTITRRDISAVIDSLPPEYAALPRNVFAVMRKLFVWAQQRGDIERSPCDGVKSPTAVPSRDRVLDDEELMLIAAFSGDLGKPFGPFLRMLIVTGQRRDEVAAMTWDEVNRSKREWVLPAHRVKNGKAHIMPLNDIAMRGLDEMAGSSKWPRKGLVFSTTGKRPISGFARMKRRLDALVATASRHRVVTPWRLHDFRRTMATNLQRLGVRFEVTEALLNHMRSARSGVAGVYQRHDWQTEKRDAVDKWDSKLVEMIDTFAAAMAKNEHMGKV